MSKEITARDGKTRYKLPLEDKGEEGGGGKGETEKKKLRKRHKPRLTFVLGSNPSFIFDLTL